MSIDEERKNRESEPIAARATPSLVVVGRWGVGA